MSIHSIRIFNFAILDVIGTFLIAEVFSYYTKIPLIISCIIWLIIGIISHVIFKKNTTLNHYLGLSDPSDLTTSEIIKL